jgi:hypothetical protein
VHYAKAALRGGVPIAASVVAASVHPGSSATVMFTAKEHMAFASGATTVASEIGGAAIASASACNSSAVA